MLTINGDMGEGGGQVLRTALTLSMCQRKAFRINNIRKRRKRPGLQRQHLAAVKAAMTITHALTQGVELDSQALTFQPQTLTAEDYHINIGSAGSAPLVAQTLLPALMLANAPSSITLEGGTHNPQAPSFDFFEQVFCPLINRMGPKISVHMQRAGFYPRGGGIMHLKIQPAAKLRALTLLDRGKVQAIRAVILLAHLSEHIALRERRVISQLLEIDENQLMIRQTNNALGPGNAVMISVISEQLTEMFTRYGVRGVPAERVAETAVKETQAYLSAGVPVGTHLADQLLVPLALAGQGVFITSKPSLHTLTNMAVIKLFTGMNFNAKQMAENRWRIDLCPV